MENPAEIEVAAASEEKAEKAKRSKKTELFPVKLDKNYRPMGEFLIEDADGMRKPTDEELAKVSAGTIIHVPVEEARHVINNKIAQRNDPIG